MRRWFRTDMGPRLTSSNNCSVYSVGARSHDQYSRGFESKIFESVRPSRRCGRNQNARRCTHGLNAWPLSSKRLRCLRHTTPSIGQLLWNDDSSTTASTVARDISNSRILSLFQHGGLVVLQQCLRRADRWAPCPVHSSC